MIILRTAKLYGGTWSLDGKKDILGAANLIKSF